MIALGLALFLCSQSAQAYSLLSHEQVIDLTWKDAIVPLLLSQYPGLTPAQLKEARAYAYGGCVIQDIGYYPLGDRSFSNLTHYVRTGDFVVNLFRNARDADELAFAVGALSHYVGDSLGHSLATNLSVPVEFPALAAKYGPVVSYAEGEHQHVQTEFAFDIDQVARRRMAPLPFLRHVGLKVPVDQLAKAYYETYGLTEDFSGRRGRRINVRAYRFATRTFIPYIAYALTMLHRKDEPSDPTTPEALHLQSEIAQVAAENNWNAYRHHAGIGTYALAGLIFILPKFGPLKLVAIKGPTAATEADYIHSLRASVAALHMLLARFTVTAAERPNAPNSSPSASTAETTPEPPPDGQTAVEPEDGFRSSDRRHPLHNRDLDTGNVVKPGEYSLTDSTFADLLHRLTRTPDRPIPPGVVTEIEAFYADPDAPITTKKDPARWAEVQADLQVLRNMPTSAEPGPYPRERHEAATKAATEKP